MSRDAQMDLTLRFPINFFLTPLEILESKENGVIIAFSAYLYSSEQLQEFQLFKLLHNEWREREHGEAPEDGRRHVYC